MIGDRLGDREHRGFMARGGWLMLYILLMLGALVWYGI
jgi:hypothetical protein